MSLNVENAAETVNEHLVDEYQADEYQDEYQDLWDELQAATNALETEDDEPVDSIISERQQRLLVDALYASWQAPEPFVALANVGLFYAVSSPAIVPDMLLSLGVEPHPNLKDYSNKLYRAYIMWQYAKPPDLVLEIVSNTKGNELGSKLKKYAELGIEYYVVYDPLVFYGTPSLRVFLRRGRQYEEIDEAVFPDIGLRLGMWNGTYQGIEGDWLRWFTMDGTLLLVSEELSTLLKKEQKRTEQERKRTEQERKRTEQERSRADEAEARAEALAAKLRALGIEP
jgi:Uma2 family endonuclease